MSNLTALLKEEFARMARKQLRGETEQLKKASAKYRSEIAALKRRLTDLERQLDQAQRGTRTRAKEGIEVAASDGANGHGAVRYSAKSLIAQRKRLGLSAADFGRLMNVSAQTIYNWESHKGQPRNKQLTVFGAVRQLRRRDAAAILASS